MQRTVDHRTTRHKESRADLATWGGNLFAMIGAAASIGAGAIGMLIAFGYINEDSTAPFNDGMSWLLAGVVVGIVANILRREHHVLDDRHTATGEHRADDLDLFLGNGMGFVLGALAVASAVVGLLLNFEYIKEGNVNPFEDALVWFSAGGILGLAALTFRREPHVSGLRDAETYTEPRVDYDRDRTIH